MSESLTDKIMRYNLNNECINDCIAAKKDIADNISGIFMEKKGLINQIPSFASDLREIHADILTKSIHRFDISRYWTPDKKETFAEIAHSELNSFYSDCELDAIFALKNRKSGFISLSVGKNNYMIGKSSCSLPALPTLALGSVGALTEYLVLNGEFWKYSADKVRTELGLYGILLLLLPTVLCRLEYVTANPLLKIANNMQNTYDIIKKHTHYQD